MFLHPCELVVIERLPEAPLVFDGGAFTGEFTQAVLDRRQRAYVLAFEPQSGAAEVLRQQYDSDGRVDVFEVALGDEDGQRELMSDFPTSVLATFHDRPSLPLDLKHREMVEMRRVREFQDDRTLDLLKLDCEGHELEILKGTDLDKVDRILWEHCEGPSRWTDVTVQDFADLLEGFYLKVLKDRTPDDQMMFLYAER